MYNLLMWECYLKLIFSWCWNYIVSVGVASMLTVTYWGLEILNVTLMFRPEGPPLPSALVGSINLNRMDEVWGKLSAIWSCWHCDGCIVTSLSSMNSSWEHYWVMQSWRVCFHFQTDLLLFTLLSTAYRTILEKERGKKKELCVSEIQTLVGS